MLRAQHVPCWGEIGQERERKQMRGAIQGDKGGFRAFQEEEA